MTQENNTNYTIQLEKHSFSGAKKGDHLVITARIHGNEPSGEIAARRIIREIQSGQLKLARGKLTIFPLLNPLAKEANVRGVWVDTNRDLHIHTNGNTPEHKIRQAICQEFSKLKTFWSRLNWHLLDLHSVPLPGEAHTIVSDQKSHRYYTGSGPFEDATNVKHEIAFAQATGTPTIYEGWRPAWRAAAEADIKALGYTKRSFLFFNTALIHAAIEHGAQTSVCVESGQDDDPHSVETAYRAIRNALQFHGLTDEPALPFPPPQKPSVIRFEKVLVRRDESEHLVDITTDAQAVKPGQVLLRGATREVCVPHEPGNDGKSEWLIAHPIPSAGVGRHLGFLARKIS